MKVTTTALPSVLLIEPKVFGDTRGYFFETWQLERYRQHGINANFVQDNLSFSQRGVLRGLHYQYENVQGKLVYVLQGSVFDVVVDIRQDSANFGKWLGVELSAENKRQLYVPPGFAHGFCVTSDAALFAYKCTDVYNPAAEITVLWNDPAIGIVWPIAHPILADKDKQGLPLSAVPTNKLLRF